MHELALAKLEQGRLDEAGPLFGGALEIAESAYGEDSPRLVELLEDYAEYSRVAGDSGRATELAQRAASIEALRRRSD